MIAPPIAAQDDRTSVEWSDTGQKHGAAGRRNEANPHVANPGTLQHNLWCPTQRDGCTTTCQRVILRRRNDGWPLCNEAYCCFLFPSEFARQFALSIPSSEGETAQ